MMDTLLMRQLGKDLPFEDRCDAGRRLAERLRPYRGRQPLLLAIPRGGVPVAAEVAKALGTTLDIMVARKLGAPGRPDLAIGAVTAHGPPYLNDEIVRTLGVSDAYVDSIVDLEREEAAALEHRFHGGRRPARLEARTVIVVDDGLTTGASMAAVVLAARQQRPHWVIAAAPVGARAACSNLARLADEVVCLAQPDPFFALGLYYEDFQPTPDSTVERLLRGGQLMPA